MSYYFRALLLVHFSSVLSCEQYRDVNCVDANEGQDSHKISTEFSLCSNMLTGNVYKQSLRQYSNDIDNVYKLYRRVKPNFVFARGCLPTLNPTSYINLQHIAYMNLYANIHIKREHWFVNPVTPSTQAMNDKNNTLLQFALLTVFLNVNLFNSL